MNLQNDPKYLQRCLFAISNDCRFRDAAFRVSLALRNFECSDEVPLDHEIESIFQGFYDVVVEVSNPWIKWYHPSNRSPSKSVDKSSTHSIWFNSTCVKFKSKWRSLQRHARTSSCIDPELLDRLKDVKRDYCRMRKASRRRLERGHIAELTQLRKFDPKEMWKRLSGKTKSRGKIKVPLADVTEYFVKLNEDGSPYGRDLLDSIRHSYIEVLRTQSRPSYQDIWTIDFLDDIWKNKLGNAPGVDGWTPEVARLLLPVIRSSLEQLFRLLMAAAYIRRVWNRDLKIPSVKPMKSGVSVAHLRPITLLSIILKSFERWCVFLTEKDYTPPMKPREVFGKALAVSSVVSSYRLSYTTCSSLRKRHCGRASLALRASSTRSDMIASQAK